MPMKGSLQRFAARAVAGAFVSAGVAVAIGSSVSCSNEAAPDVVDAGGVITIALLQSLTGTEGPVGRPLKDAAQVAEWQLNAGGGLLGQRVRLEIKDDGPDINAAQARADEVIFSGLKVAVGPTASPEAVLMVPRLVAARVLTISSTVTSPALTKAEPPLARFFFRTLPPNDVQGRVAAAFTANPAAVGVASTACKNMAIVQADDAYGNPYADAVEQRFRELGGAVVSRQKIPSDLKATYDAEIDALIGALPLADCVSLICFAAPGAAFMRDYRRKTAGNASRDWTKVPVIGANALYTSNFIVNGRVNPADPSSPSAAEGVYGVLVDPEPRTPEYSSFARLFKARFPLAPDQRAIPRNTANTYDAVILMALAIQKAGTATDSTLVRDALFDVSKGGRAYGPDQVPEALDAIRRGIDIDYHGASGDVDFDDNGNVKEDMIVWQVKDGAFQAVTLIKAENLQ